MNYNSAQLQHNIPLKDKNTLGLNAFAKDFFILKNEKDCFALQDIYASYKANNIKTKFFTLGEGSNTVFTQKNIETFIIKIENKGINIEKEDDENIWINCKSGELFRDFVLWCCEKNYCGLENLAAIYGTVGAAPVQNIGAYGSEVKNVVDSVRYFDLEDGIFHIVSNKECNFSYRNSIFKYQNGEKIITEVTFKLNKHFHFNNSYKILAESFAGMPINEITPSKVAEKVTYIRNQKLPNPKEFGNCGSFFKNPVISLEHYNNLKEKYPDIVSFDDIKGEKISAGWLIEKCGFKGKKINNVGMHDKQALILVNYGVKDAQQLINYAQTVMDSIKNTFDINLVMEPHTVL